MKIPAETFLRIQAENAERAALERQRKEDVKNYIIPGKPATAEDSIVALTPWEKFIRGGAAGLFLNSLVK